ncbi:hypothetical protein KR009_007775 [Drosophila setifemur]|nr:hypothetical protein KR009_007775 [Drosophila setifemur]
MSDLVMMPDLRTFEVVPLRKKEYLAKERQDRVNGNIFKAPEICLERPRELLERMKRSASASRLPMTTQNIQPIWERPKTPEMRSPYLVVPYSEPRPLRSKELVENMSCGQRTPSANKIQIYFTPSTPQNQQDNWDLIKTPETGCTCPYIVSTEPRPLRTKELLERMGLTNERSRPASVSKIGRRIPQKPRSKTSSLTTSNLMVPSIGFSYPKAASPKLTNSKRRQAVQHEMEKSSLANSKRRLEFQHEVKKDSERQKLARIAKHIKEHRVAGWQVNIENRLRQLSISDFVSLLIYLLPTAGVEVRQLSKDCYVEQLMEALPELGYPRKVNRTWLRLPGVPHVIGHVLEILDFLMDFAENRDKGKSCLLPKVQKQLIFDRMVKNVDLDGDTLYQKKLELVSETSCTARDFTELQEDFKILNLERLYFDQDDKINNLRMQKKRLEDELIKNQEELKILTSASTDRVQEMAKYSIENISPRQSFEELSEGVGSQISNSTMYARLQDPQEERSQHRKMIQEFSEYVTLAKQKLNRCQRELMESIEAFNVQIRDFEYSLKGSH